MVHGIPLPGTPYRIYVGEAQPVREALLAKTNYSDENFGF
jgi:hypothetical protein